MKLDLKEKFSELKTFAAKLDRKVKIISIVVAVVIIGGAVTTALILNHKEYVPIFSEVSEEEAAEIVGKLQEDGVDYQYKGGGTILVEKSQADSTRANLVYEGYPKSGFTYDIFTQNAGGMATDSEKQTYKLYELQNRIGATISLFNGVKDAKVTIALGEEQKYVLEDTSQTQDGPSASVVVTMKSGAELEQKQAAAIQRLVAKSIPDMQMENVAVFDENGIDLTAGEAGQNAGTTEAELSRIVEQKIEQKVINVLLPFYGDGNVKVSANGKINMDKVIRETTTYTTPDKINQNDKTGIISHEQGSTSEGTGTGAAAGVAGTEENADITEYNQQDGAGAENYNSTTYDRDYVINQVKEQTEIDPGVMDDLTVAVSINGETLGELNGNEIRELVANATGIGVENSAQKITVVAAPFYTEEADAKTAGAKAKNFLKDSWWILAAAAGIFLFFLIVFLLIRRRIRKRKTEKDEFLQGETIPDLSVQENEQDNIDILNMKNGKSRELRENIRDFAETNPEISAQMLRSWLNGGEQDGRN